MDTQDVTATAAVVIQSPAFTQADFEALEALLNEPPVPPSGEISLDDLMAESMETIHASKAVKAARAKLKDTRTTNRERAELNEIIRKWELAREWKPQATVAMFSTQDCENCGYVQGIFVGLFQREAHRHNHTTRWVIPSAVNDSLPIERKENLTAVPMCLACVEDLGYFEPEEDEGDPLAELMGADDQTAQGVAPTTSDFDLSMEEPGDADVEFASDDFNGGEE